MAGSTSAGHGRTLTAGSPPSPAEEEGEKRRLRPESFADHYSQASLFYRSQQPVEQQHIIDAFTFELSKVERADIRERMVANLRNVDDDLAGASRTASGSRSCPPRPSPPSPPASTSRSRRS